MKFSSLAATTICIATGATVEVCTAGLTGGIAGTAAGGAAKMLTGITGRFAEKILTDHQKLSSSGTKQSIANHDLARLIGKAIARA